MVAPNERMQLTWLIGAPSWPASVHWLACGRLGLGSPATQLMRAVGLPLQAGVDISWEESRTHAADESRSVHNWEVMVIQAFNEDQSEELSALIGRVLLMIISRDYPPAYVFALLEEFTPANIRALSRKQDIYVALEDGHIVGTASLARYGTPEAPQYYGTSVFVAPEYHGKGIGRELMRRIESKASDLGSAMLTVRAAMGARGFYRKLGYSYQDRNELPDVRGNHVMEKIL